MTGTVILSLLKKLLTNKWFWYAVIAFFAFMLVRKYWDDIKQLFQKSEIDYLPGESKNISSARELELKSLAEDLYEAIYATQTVGVKFREDKFNEANDLSDNELRFVSKYYRKSVTKDNWLYTDINNESMPLTTVDEKLMARLSKVGEKG